MRAPRFWYPADGRDRWQARLLAPLSPLYARGTRRRMARHRPYAAGVPVVCIGNINAGGTGKTPTVIACLERLAARGVRAAVVSRGYGGRAAGPIQVDPRSHDADEVGDEPLLHAAFAETWVAKDRAGGVRAAEAGGPDLILLDDGHQSPAVEKTASIIVVDGRRGFGNGRVIPAGPLREPLAEGLARADMLLVIGDEGEQRAFERHWGQAIALPRVRATVGPLATGMRWEGLPVLAFAGIGYPEKFFNTLKAMGVDLKRTKALSDHQALSPALMARLTREAAALGAQLVTTEKDAVRLPGLYRQQVMTLPVRLAFNDPAPIDDLFTRVISG